MFHGLLCSVGLIKFDEFLEGQLIAVSVQTLNNRKFPISSLPSANEGNVFTSVCQEFCPRGGGVSARHIPLGRHPLAGRHPAGQADTPSPADGYCSGWYASYWNAFLLQLFFTIKILQILNDLYLTPTFAKLNLPLINISYLQKQRMKVDCQIFKI